MFTKEAIALSKPCYEAIKKIAERQERVCPECKGFKTIVTSVEDGEGKRSLIVDCSTCDAIGKVKGKWEWEPEVGERCILDNNIRLIYDLLEDKDYGIHIYYYDAKHNTHRCKQIEHIIPFLHWERIEEILEGMGYHLDLESNDLENTYWRAVFWKSLSEQDTIETLNFNSISRQLAVMRAVIELGGNNAKHGNK